ncbi:MAG: hypothetical protein ABIQ52_03515, partial [Vicinamibacterales bacterium]
MRHITSGILSAAFATALISCSNRMPGPANAAATEATIFAPGVISNSTRNEQGITFTPDGRTAIFSVLKGRVENRNFWQIMISDRTSSGWSDPEVASFSGETSDYGPAISPDGQSLYFMSRRTAPGGAMKADYDIWVTRRRGEHWSTPESLPFPINSIAEEYSVTASRSALYFAANRPDTRGNTDLYRASMGAGEPRVTNVGDAVNS